MEEGLTGEVFGGKLAEDFGVCQSLRGVASAEEREELELSQFELQTTAVGQQPVPVDHRPSGWGTDTHLPPL